MVPLESCRATTAILMAGRVEVFICGANARIVPGSDLAEKDIGVNVLGQLKPAFDAWKIVGEHNHARGARHLNDAAVDLLYLGWRKDVIAGREIDGAGQKARDAFAGAYSIIVDADIGLGIFKVIDPAFHKRGRQRSIRPRGVPRHPQGLAHQVAAIIESAPASTAAI